MASFRVHEDQENYRPDQPSKEIVNISVQQNRKVLGAIDNTTKLSLTITNLKQHQPLQDLKNQDENGYSKAQIKKPVPIVPVAQFEAFKVYEDHAEAENASPKSNDKEDSEIEQLTDNEEFKGFSPMSSEEHLHENKKISQFATYTSGNKSALENEEREGFYDVPEYREDIYKYLREAELRNRPKTEYMKKQPDITYAMRTILVDWLVEVAEEYRLQTETLYLAVSYIDRFLSYMSVVRAKLQLVGTAAMFLASKYEEIYPPEIGEFVYITDDTYNKKQVIRMEQLILKVLQFDISIPTPLTFLKNYCAWTAQNDRVLFLSMYICELSMLEADPYLQYLPSVLAASAINLARITLEMEAWPKDLQYKSGYNQAHLQKCIAYLDATYAGVSNLQQQAICEKYKASKYLHVALILPKCSTTEISNDITNVEQ